jgi:hypothetical protein
MLGEPGLKFLHQRAAVRLPPRLVDPAQIGRNLVEGWEF